MSVHHNHKINPFYSMEAHLPARVGNLAACLADCEYKIAVSIRATQKLQHVRDVKELTINTDNLSHPELTGD
jgi:hypothetical protein